MCAIVGSFDPKKLVELCKLNEYRGVHSHSIGIYDCEDKSLIGIERKLGPMNYEHVSSMKQYPNNEVYYIAHMQAPTGAQTSKKCIHPAQLLWFSHGESYEYLYHNGILKQKEIERLQEKYNVDAQWDTYLLLLELQKEYPEIDIDGSFSCLYMKDGYFPLLFRNELCPMFFDNELNLSSTEFENSVSTRANIVYCVDMKSKSLIEFQSFKTKNMPYYIEE